MHGNREMTGSNSLHICVDEGRVADGTSLGHKGRLHFFDVAVDERVGDRRYGVCDVLYCLFDSDLQLCTTLGCYLYTKRMRLLTGWFAVDSSMRLSACFSRRIDFPERRVDIL